MAPSMSNRDNGGVSQDALEAEKLERGQRRQRVSVLAGREIRQLVQGVVEPLWADDDREEEPGRRTRDHAPCGEHPARPDPRRSTAPRRIGSARNSMCEYVLHHDASRSSNAMIATFLKNRSVDERFASCDVHNEQHDTRPHRRAPGTGSTGPGRTVEVGGRRDEPDQGGPYSRCRVDAVDELLQREDSQEHGDEHRRKRRLPVLDAREHRGAAPGTRTLPTRRPRDGSEVVVPAIRPTRLHTVVVDERVTSTYPAMSLLPNVAAARWSPAARCLKVRHDRSCSRRSRRAWRRRRRFVRDRTEAWSSPYRHRRSSRPSSGREDREPRRPCPIPSDRASTTRRPGAAPTRPRERRTRGRAAQPPARAPSRTASRDKGGAGSRPTRRGGIRRRSSVVQIV